MRIDFAVVGTPATKGSARAFAFRRRNGKLGASVVNDNPRGKSWEARVSAAAQDAMPLGVPRVGPVEVQLTFYLARPKSHYRTGKHSGELRDTAPMLPAGKPDIDKLARAVLDGLTGACIVDDAQVTTLLARKRYAWVDWQGGREGVGVVVVAI